MRTTNTIYIPSASYTPNSYDSHLTLFPDRMIFFGRRDDGDPTLNELGCI